MTTFRELPAEIRGAIWFFRYQPAIIHIMVSYDPLLTPAGIEVKYNISVATKRNHHEVCSEELAATIRTRKTYHITPHTQLSTRYPVSISLSPRLDILYLQTREYGELATFFCAYPTITVDEVAFEFWDNSVRKLYDNLAVTCCSLPKLTRIFIVCLHITDEMIAIEVNRCRKSLAGARELSRAGRFGSGGIPRRISIHFGHRIAASDTPPHILKVSEDFDPDYYEFYPTSPV